MYNSLELHVRIFKDDLSSLMEGKYSNEYNSNSDLDSPLIQSKIREYLETNISIYFDNIKYHPKCLGTENKNDLIVCYLELEKIPISNIIKLENKILFELFLDQKNIIHVKKNNNKQSFILTKDNSDYTLDI